MYRILLLFAFAMPHGFAADKEIATAPRSFMAVANAMYAEWHSTGKAISVEQLKSHAAALLKFLEGEPKGREKLAVDRRLDGAADDEIVIVAAYDNGSSSRGYIFRFQKTNAALTSVTIVRGG